MQFFKDIFGLVPWGWIVALILGLMAIRALRPSVHKFFDRANKFTAGSFAAEATPQQIASEKSQNREAAIEIAAASSSYEEYQKAIQPFRFASMTKRVEKVKANIDLQQFTVEQLREMVGDCAGLILMTIEFESLYTIIFGSQILLLQDLNGAYATGRALDRAKYFYESAVKSFPQIYQNYSFEQWLGYLVNNALLNRESNLVMITEEGRDFLRYLVQAGKVMLKEG